MKTTANMFALLSDEHRDYQVAIPPGLTYDEVVYWLDHNDLTSNYWHLAGIFEYSYKAGAA